MSVSHNQFLCHQITLLLKWLDDIMLAWCLSNNNFDYVKLHARIHITMQRDFELPVHLHAAM
jgi:hypothetical protein